MTDPASHFVGDIPKHYDQGLGPIIFDDYAADMARRAAGLKPESVLELAAGSGIVSRKLRDSLTPATRLVVTDLNAPMLEVAKAKFSTEEGVEFLPADATELGFSDDAFDLVVCQFGVMFFPDKIASFREAVRVLRPGGRYLFSTWGTMQDNPFSEIAHSVTAEFFPDDPPGFYKVPFSYADPETVMADMKAAGLEQIECDTIARNKTVSDVEAFARGIVFGNPLIDEIRSRGGVDEMDVFRAVVSGLKQKWSEGPISMPLKANVFSGRV